jgi:PBP1b-binding outer membrane lipoprotein LpoB
MKQITLTTAIQRISIIALVLILTACNGSRESSNSVQEQQKDERVTPHHTGVKDTPNPQHPSDQPFVTIKGYQIPIINAPTLEDAIEKAKAVLGPRSHGYLMWNEKIYNFEGKEVTLD